MSVMRDVEILRAACCIAGLDGAVCEREMPLLAALAERAGVGGASLRAMISRAENDRDFHQELFDALKADGEATIGALFAVATADGDLRQEERVILRFFADRLGMDEATFDAALTRAERSAAATRKG